MGQTLGKGGNGSLLGTKGGSKVPLGPKTKLPPPPVKKPADRMDFVGDVGRAALGAAVGAAGDQDGDGFDDLFISDPDVHAVFIFLGGRR